MEGEAAMPPEGPRGAPRSAGAEEVTRRLAAHEVPEWLREFISYRWKQLLVLRHFRHGEEGEGWTTGLETLDDLLWSVEPDTDVESRRRLVESLPYLVARVKAGIRDLAMAPEEADEFMATLSDMHLQIVRPEVAAETRIDSGAPAPAEERDDARLVRESVAKANGAVFRAARANGTCEGMGTTVVAVIVRDGVLTVGHVGDSRLYRLRDGHIAQVTLDHSMLQDLISKLGCTREEALELTASNLLTRAVGVDEQTEVDVLAAPVELGDRYLLCTDGLTDLLDEEEMEAVLNEPSAEPGVVCAILVQRANEEGGHDNVTVAVLEVGEGGVRIDGRSDVGRRRSHNEDSLIFDADRAFAVLADGMGGHNAGEVASEMTVQIVGDALAGSVEVAASAEEAGTEAGADTLDSLADVFDVEDMDVEIIEIVAPPPPALDEDSPWLDAVEELEAGAWVEFRTEEHVVRARLSRISPESGRYLFTDRLGNEVADSTARGLALEIERGALVILDTVPLLDRTLNGLSSALRRASA